MIKKHLYRIAGAVFILLLIVLFFFLGFNNVFFSGPMGLHFIRQTDSLSFASLYLRNGFDFFHPQLYNLSSTDGKAACEFPILYYVTAILYTLLGKKLFLLKLLHLIIVYTGVFYIFRMAYQLLKDYFYAALISLFLFTSTVFNYYSFNYLPDAGALGFVFIGWSLFFRYQGNHKKKTLLLSFLFFTLGSLIKVTYLINPLAVMVFSAYALLFHKKNLMTKSRAKNTIIYGIIGVALVILWNVYMIYYNALNNATYFNTTANPIWALTKENIAVVWDYISNYWYSKYFAESAFHLLLIVLMLQIVFLKKSDPKVSLPAVVLFFGSIVYFVLFYAQFKHHDYYFMAFFPLVILVLVNGIRTLQNISKKPLLHLAVKLVFLTIVIVSINYSRMKLSDRYTHGYDDFSRIGFLIEENANGIKYLNIPEDAMFIVAPDYCPNGGLLFLDRMGWNIGPVEKITSGRIQHYNKLGATYLLLATDEEEVLAVGDATGELIFDGKGLRIFQLNATPAN